MTILAGGSGGNEMALQRWPGPTPGEPRLPNEVPELPREVPVPAPEIRPAPVETPAVQPPEIPGPTDSRPGERRLCEARR